MGWLRKISRDFKHSPRISASVNWTFFPGREPRTEGGVEGEGEERSGGRNTHLQLVQVTGRQLRTYVCDTILPTNSSSVRKLPALI